MSSTQASPTMPSAGLHPLDISSSPVEGDNSLPPIPRADSPSPVIQPSSRDNDIMDHEASPPNEADHSHSDDETNTSSTPDVQDEMQVDNNNNLTPIPVAILVAGSNIAPPNSEPSLGIFIPPVPIPTTNIPGLDPPSPPIPQSLHGDIIPAPPLADMPPPAPPMEEEEDEFDGQMHFLRAFQEDPSEPPPEQLEEMSRQEQSGSRNFQISGQNHEHWLKQVEMNIDDPAFRPNGKGQYTWHLERFHGTKENPNKDRIMRSPVFVVGGYKWNLKLFPHGTEGTDYVSVYIECGGPQDPTTAVEPWDVAAQMGCVMYNPAEPRTHHFDRASHHFETNNTDWGWVRFYGPWQELHQRRFLEYRPMLQNDKVSITAYIRTWEDPTKLLFSPSLKNGNWNSFKQTGFRGLTADMPGNTALTSAMSLLFHTSAFNDMIAEAPWNDPIRRPEAKRSPMIQELKRVLHRWHTQSNSMHAESLSGVQRLLSWYGHQVDSSTDIIQIWEALSTIMGCEMVGSVSDSSSLPLSKMLLFRDTREPRMTADAPRPDSKACKSVQEIFGDSRGHAVQKQPLFPPQSLPSEDYHPNLIAVELQRSGYDVKKRKWCKLTHHIHLDSTIRLGDNLYNLTGAVVHRGELGSGDFYSVIKPNGSKNWLKYRSGQVALLTQRQAIDIHEGKGESKAGTDTVAYVLLYAKDNAVPSREDFKAQDVLQKLGQSNPDLRSDESIPIIIHDASEVNKHKGLGFVDPWAADSSNILNFSIRAGANLIEVQEALLDRLKALGRAERKEQLRLWPIRTARSAPRYVLDLDGERWPDAQLTDFVAENGGAHLWLEIIPVDKLAPEDESKPDLMEMSVGSIMPPAAPTTTNETPDVVMANTEDEASESGSEDDDDDDEGEDDDDDEDGSSTSMHPDWELVDHCYVILKTWNPQTCQLACQGAYFVPDRKQNIHEWIRKTLKVPTSQKIKVYQETGRTLDTEISAKNELGQLDSQAVVLVVSHHLPDKLADQRRKAGEPVDVVDWYKVLHAEKDQSKKNEYTVQDYFGGPYIKYSSSLPRGKSTVVDTKGDAFIGDLDFNWIKNGTGTMIYTNGNKYEGEWKDDLADGTGTMTYNPSGNRYVGGWKTGRRHGKGVMYYEQSEDQLRTCKICYDEEMDTVLVKCGHIVACHVCAGQLKDCPICRRPVSDVVRVYATI